MPYPLFEPGADTYGCQAAPPVPESDGGYRGARSIGGRAAAGQRTGRHRAGRWSRRLAPQPSDRRHPAGSPPGRRGSLAARRARRHPDRRRKRPARGSAGTRRPRPVRDHRGRRPPVRGCARPPRPRPRCLDPRHADHRRRPDAHHHGLRAREAGRRAPAARRRIRVLPQPAEGSAPSTGSGADRRDDRRHPARRRPARRHAAPEARSPARTWRSCAPSSP